VTSLRWTRYEFGRGEGSLLDGALPAVDWLPAKVGESAGDVLRRLDGGTQCLVFHLDLTLTGRLPLDRPRLVRALADRGVAVFNAACTDTSKRRVQRLCRGCGLRSVATGPKGDPAELVIVKTDYNFHGEPEAALGDQQRELLGYPPLPADLRGPGRYRYAVVPRAEVPAAVWSAPHLVVERYVDNRRHHFYRVYIAGVVVVVSRVVDRAQLKKMPEGIERQSRYFAVSELRRTAARDDFVEAARTAARFTRAAQTDFGALDLVSDDERRLHVVDANLTPWWGAGGHPDLLSALGSGLQAAAQARLQAVKAAQR
jgi:hypothetical protein